MLNLSGGYEAEFFTGFLLKNPDLKKKIINITNLA
jgi:hypothetical protein